MIKVNRQPPVSPAEAEDAAPASRPDARLFTGPQTDRNRGDSMTQRERPTPDTASRPPRGPVAPSAAASQSLAPAVFAASAGPSFWEQWYAQAGEEQRQQVLELARQQGVLCAVQLPA